MIAGLDRRACWILGGAALLQCLLAPLPGYERDLYWFGTWMRTAFEHGAAHVSEKVWCDYPPGYLYVLEGSAFLWRLVTGASLPADGTLALRCLLKIPGIVSNIVGAALLYTLACRHLPRGKALAVLAGYSFNPAMVFDAAVWGQVDGLPAALLLASTLLVLGKRPALGFALLVLAVLVKLQAIVVLPILLVAVYLLEGSCGLWEASRGGSISGLLVLLPFFWAGRVDSVISSALTAVGRYPAVSKNAHNIWWLFGGTASPGLSDVTRFGNATWTYRTVGTAMLGLATVLILWRLWRSLRRRPDEAAPAVLEAVALQLWAFYLFPTQMHERYLVPALIFLASASVFRGRLAWIYGAVSSVVCVSLASTQQAVYPGGVPFVGSWFPPGRGDTVVWSVCLTGLFVTLLVWVPDRAVVLAVPGSALALWGAVALASHVRVGAPVRLSAWEAIEGRQGWGELQRDRSVEGKRLSVSGFVFRHGLGTHAPSRLQYGLAGAFRVFDTLYWIDDEANAGQRMQFRVLVDGRVAHDSGVVSGWQFPRHAIVDVSGAMFLTLEVLDGGDGMNGDHADWLEPELIR